MNITDNETALALLGETRSTLNLAARAYSSATRAVRAAEDTRTLAHEIRIRANTQVNELLVSLEQQNEGARIAWHEAARRFVYQGHGSTLWVRADGKARVECVDSVYLGRLIVARGTGGGYEVWSAPVVEYSVLAGESPDQARGRLQTQLNDLYPPGGTWYDGWHRKYMADRDEMDPRETANMPS